MNITTYYVRKGNPLAVLSAICMIVSAIARMVFFCGAASEGAGVIIVHVAVPVAANLLFSIMLLLKGGKQLYVTRGCFVLYAVYFVIKMSGFGLRPYMSITCIALTLLQTVIAYMTLDYKLGSRYYMLAAYLLPLLFFADADFLFYLIIYWEEAPMFLIADLGIYFGILFMILAVRKRKTDVDQPVLMPGDREDGRRIRTRNFMDNMAGFFMPVRSAASNFISDYVEITGMEKYIHNKRKEGLKHFGIMHVILGAYVRTCAEYPQINRFFSGQRTYHRFDIVCNLIVKKSMETEAEDTMVKAHFKETDTVYEIYETFNEIVQRVKETEENSFDSLVKYLNLVPRLVLKFALWAVKCLDYFGMVPEGALEFSPFHGSMFITSMGSLGIPPIFHHLYDFGNVPVFIAFGAKRSTVEIDAEGNRYKRKYIDYTAVTDERICDGFTYAQALKRIRFYLLHPERLDVPPEKVVEDIR